MEHELLIVLNAGGSEAQRIARLARDMCVYSEVLPDDVSIDEIKKKNPKGVIAEKEADYGVPLLLNSSVVTGEALNTFLFDKCGFKGDWRMDTFAEKMIGELKDKLSGKKILLAMSGGVDSVVCAALMHKSGVEGMTCIFVDHGLMRLNEGDEVEALFNDRFGDINLVRVNAEERFLSKLAAVENPEMKRKIIGEEFIRVFEEEAEKTGAVDVLVQGTIYTDIIESGTKNSDMVKSHHNVGGLPDLIDFKEIVEPLKYLFKDEVKKLGIVLGLPENMVYRQTFPGPGLAVRTLGEVTKVKLDILRKADYIFRDEIAKAGLDRKIWMYFAVLTNLRSVGVADGKRTYGYTIALRGVNSTDVITASFVKIPYEVLEAASIRITSEVPEVNRVVYDITSKPPSTIEWE